MRKRVYIAGPIVKGDLGHNVGQAVDAFIALIKAGLSPLCPHLSCFSGGVVKADPRTASYYAKAEVLPAGTTVEQWYETDLPWVDVSEALLRLPGEGKGSDGEVARATELGIPVFYSVEEAVAWSKSVPPEASATEPSGTSAPEAPNTCPSETSPATAEPAAKTSAPTSPKRTPPRSKSSTETSASS